MATRQPYMGAGQQGPAGPAAAAGSAPQGGPPLGPQVGRVPMRPPMTGAQNPQAMAPPPPPPPADPTGGGPTSPFNIGPMVTPKSPGLSPGMRPEGEQAPTMGQGMGAPLGGAMPPSGALVPAPMPQEGGAPPAMSAAIMLKLLQAMGHA